MQEVFPYSHKQLAFDFLIHLLGSTSHFALYGIQIPAQKIILLLRKFAL